MRRALVILIVTVLAGLFISWLAMSMAPSDEKLQVSDPKPGGYQGAEPNAQQKYAPGAAR